MQGQWFLYHLKCDDLPAEYEESQGYLQSQNIMAGGKKKPLAIHPASYMEKENHHRRGIPPKDIGYWDTTS